MIRGSRLAALAAMALLLARGVRADEPNRRNLAELFAPDYVSQIALAPDGEHLAYVTRDGTAVGLEIVALRGANSQRVALELGRDAVIGQHIARFKVPYLEWADSHSLLYGVDPPRIDRNRTGAVRVVDAEGHHDRKLVDGHDFQILTPGGPILRPPHVIGLLEGPSPTLGIDVRGFASRRLPGDAESYAVDVGTGRFALRSTGTPGAALLFDRTGEVRLLETPRVKRSGAAGEQEFRIRPKQDKWEDLDRYIGTASGPQFRFSDETYYAPRSIPLAFGRDPNVLYYASNVGRDTMGVYAFDLVAHKPTALAVENSGYDLADVEDAFSPGPLVFDRQGILLGVRLGGDGRTRWFDPTLAAKQTTLDRSFPSRWAEIIGWDDARDTVLAAVAGPGDPGRFVLLESNPTRLTEVARSIRSLAYDGFARAQTFSFTHEGVALTGMITLPRRTRVFPAPLVVLCRDFPGRQSRDVQRGAFTRDAQALAAMGFAVAEVNYRGLTGFGLAHRNGARTAPDGAPVDDVRTAIEWLAGRYKFDRRRVALIGQGMGGYAAVRALERFPDEFRCAVAINAPLDLERWLAETGVPPHAPTMTRSGIGMIGNPPMPEPIARRRVFFGSGPNLRAISAWNDRGRIKCPVLFVQDAFRFGLSPEPAHALYAALRDAGLPAEYLEVTRDFASEDPDELARVMLRIGDFLNANLYDFGVKVGELREVE
jgi:dipeptidyl aminopeptidase/acylaminoacyl peptidase